MKPSRFQPLHAVYKNLCTHLYDTALHLYTTDFAKPESKDALQKTRDTLSLFGYQTAVEESVLFGAIHDYEPLVVWLFIERKAANTKFLFIILDLLLFLYHFTKTTNYIS